MNRRDFISSAAVVCAAPLTIAADMPGPWEWHRVGPYLYAVRNLPDGRVEVVGDRLRIISSASDWGAA